MVMTQLTNGGCHRVSRATRADIHCSAVQKLDVWSLENVERKRGRNG